jgi:site-specific DNA-methyltransferase (adenine-specific)
METSLELHHGDCLEILKTIPDKSIDLILCDLPYGCLTVGSGKEREKRKNTGGTLGGCTWDIKINLEAFWKEVNRIRRNDHSPCIHFCTTRFGFELIKSNEKEFRYDLVWDKQRGVSFLSANKMPMRSHEMIYVFAKAGAYYNRVDITGEFKNWVRTRTEKSEISAHYGGKRIKEEEGGDGKRCALSVIQNKTSPKKGGHPTEKPESLYRFLIERYCPVGGTVLDPTAGSGNSVFTAYDMNRNAIGIEKDDAFFAKMVKRLE